MRGQQSSLCKSHRSRTTYYSNTGWVPYHSKLSHKNTDRFLTMNKTHSQQQDLPLN